MATDPHGFTLAALVIPLFAAAGCGTDDDTIVQKATPTTHLVETTTAPEPVISTTPEPVAPVPVEPVTYQTAEQAFLDGHYERLSICSRVTPRRNPTVRGATTCSALPRGRTDSWTWRRPRSTSR